MLKCKIPGWYVIPARDIRKGDIVRAHYDEGVTMAGALRPGEQVTDQSDIDRQPNYLGTPHKAERDGAEALTFNDGRLLGDEDPVVVSRELEWNLHA